MNVILTNWKILPSPSEKNLPLQEFSFVYVDLWPKIYLILSSLLENSTAHITITSKFVRLAPN
jgi:hypothetical protein